MASKPLLLYIGVLFVLTLILFAVEFYKARRTEEYDLGDRAIAHGIFFVAAAFVAWFIKYPIATAGLLVVAGFLAYDKLLKRK